MSSFVSILPFTRSNVSIGFSSSSVQRNHTWKSIVTWLSVQADVVDLVHIHANRDALRRVFVSRRRRLSWRSRGCEQTIKAQGRLRGAANEGRAMHGADSIAVTTTCQRRRLEPVACTL